MKKLIALVICLLMAMPSALALRLTLPADTVTVEDYAFYDTDVTAVRLPDNLKLSNIGEYAFPDGVRIYGSQEGLEAWAHERGYFVGSDPKYYALVIGQTYVGASGFSGNTLPACAGDIKAVAAMLKSQSATPFTVTTRTNLTDTGILSAITADFGQATEDDVCVFYYSGHGMSESGSLIGTNFYTTTYGYVTMKKLRTAMDKIKGTKILILDSCYSGNLVQQVGGEIVDTDGTVIARSDEEVTVDLNAVNQAIISAFTGGFSPRDDGTPEYLVITASSNTQMSWTANSKGSLFTVGFVKGCGYDQNSSAVLKTMGADSNSDGMITQKEAYTYVWNNVTKRIISDGKTYYQVVQAYPTGGSSFSMWGRR